MGKQSPDYWPDELPLMGMSKVEYSESIGLKPNRLYTFFGGNHKYFVPYCRLSDETGEKLDSIYEYLASGKFDQFFEKHKKKRSLRQFCKDVGVSTAFMSDRIAGKVGTNGIQEYYDLAKKMGCNLETMRVYCKLNKPLNN